MPIVAVCSRSFSRHQQLRKELLDIFPRAYFNDEGVSLSGPSLVEFLSKADLAITALEVIDEMVITSLPNLKGIGKYGVGMDMIDFHALDKADVKFGWTGGVNKRSVSELVLTMMISLLRYVPQSNADARVGLWKQKIGRQLSNKTIGVIGCGHVGKDLIQLLQPFACRVLANDLVSFPSFYKKYGVEEVAIETIMREADVITLHLPLDESTKNIISRDRIKMMKNDAIIINTARGGLIDEVALKDALINKDIFAAGLDVLNVEPPKDLDILNLPNVLVTSHLGGSSEEAVLAMGRAAINGLNNLRSARNYFGST